MIQKCGRFIISSSVALDWVEEKVRRGLGIGGWNFREHGYLLAGIEGGTGEVRFQEDCTEKTSAHVRKKRFGAVG
jgi:hypothetical protein